MDKCSLLLINLLIYNNCKEDVQYEMGMRVHNLVMCGKAFTCKSSLV
jgi:dUTPase